MKLKGSDLDGDALRQQLSLVIVPDVFVVAPFGTVYLSVETLYANTLPALRLLTTLLTPPNTATELEAAQSVNDI